MSARTDSVKVWSRWDAAAMWFYALLGAAFVVWTIVLAVRRLIEVVTAEVVPVPAEFSGTPADAPILPSLPDQAPAASREEVRAALGLEQAG